MSNNQAVTVDIQELQQALYHKLDGSEWQDKLKMFILGSEFKTLLVQLVEEVNNDKRFTPRLKDVFNVFKVCPYNGLKAVIVGQDPYPTVGVADGIAFSCSNTDTAQPSLRHVNAAIQDCYPEYEPKLDLTVWAQQGILLINTAFTTQIGKPGTHYKIWEPFVSYLFDQIKADYPDMVYLFMGKKAQEWAAYTGDEANNLFVSHPASAVYSGGKWKHNNMFKELTDAVEARSNYRINW